MLKKSIEKIRCAAIFLDSIEEFDLFLMIICNKKKRAIDAKTAQHDIVEPI